MDLSERLLDKLPAFDPTWSPDAISAWLSLFDRIVGLAEKKQAPIVYQTQPGPWLGLPPEGPASTTAAPLPEPLVVVSASQNGNGTNGHSQNGKVRTSRVNPRVRELRAKAEEMLLAGQTYTEVAEQLELGKSTVYNYQRELQERGLLPKRD